MDAEKYKHELPPGIFIDEHVQITPSAVEETLGNILIYNPQNRLPY